MLLLHFYIGVWLSVFGTVVRKTTLHPVETSHGLVCVDRYTAPSAL